MSTGSRGADWLRGRLAQLRSRTGAAAVRQPPLPARGEPAGDWQPEAQITAPPRPAPQIEVPPPPENSESAHWVPAGAVRTAQPAEPAGAADAWRPAGATATLQPPAPTDPAAWVAAAGADTLVGTPAAPQRERRLPRGVFALVAGVAAVAVAALALSSGGGGSHPSSVAARPSAPPAVALPAATRTVVHRARPHARKVVAHHRHRVPHRTRAVTHVSSAPQSSAAPVSQPAVSSSPAPAPAPAAAPAPSPAPAQSSGSSLAQSGSSLGAASAPQSGIGSPSK